MADKTYIMRLWNSVMQTDLETFLKTKVYSVVQQVKIDKYNWDVIGLDSSDTKVFTVRMDTTPIATGDDGLVAAEQKLITDNIQLLNKTIQNFGTKSSTRTATFKIFQADLDPSGAGWENVTRITDITKAKLIPAPFMLILESGVHLASPTRGWIIYNQVKDEYFVLSDVEYNRHYLSV